MSFIITILVGIVIGWLAGLVSTSMRWAGVYTNIISGIAGSIIGFWFFVTALGLGTNTVAAGTFSGMVLVWEIIGAIVYLVIVNAAMSAEGLIGEGRGRAAYGRGTAHEYEERERRRK